MAEESWWTALIVPIVAASARCRCQYRRPMSRVCNYMFLYWVIKVKKSHLTVIEITVTLV